MNISKYRTGRKAVGEVANILGNNVSVYLYPEAYEDVSMGDFLLITGRKTSFVSVVVKNLHRVRRERSFSLMGMDYEDIKEIYPDIDRLYIYAVEAAIIGTVDLSGKLSIGLGGAPRIHDMVFKMDEEDILEVFRYRDISFDLLKYLEGYVGDDVWVREFFRRNREVLRSLGDGGDILEKLMDTLVWLGIPPATFGKIVSIFIDEVSGGG